MMRLHVDKIASATKNVPLRKEIRVSKEIPAREGTLVAGRIIGEKNTYNTLENCEGRMVPLHDGDIIVGVLGHRNALVGYSGEVPQSVSPGDILNVLNLGGVIGRCTSENPEFGKPFQIEILGSVLVFPEFENRTGVHANTSMNKLTLQVPFRETRRVPVIFVAGTCMHAGKTMAACQIIRHLDAHGLQVAACKVTGVSLLRDVLNMQDYGAKWSASFVEAGVVTTDGRSSVNAARTVIGHLSMTDADVIVAELGDGILGTYGVSEILMDPDLMERNAVLVLSANDPVGAWGAVKLLRENFNLSVGVITGPTTDNDAGTNFVADKLGVAAVNARKKGKELASVILTLLEKSNFHETK